MVDVRPPPHPGGGRPSWGSPSSPGHHRAQGGRARLGEMHRTLVDVSRQAGMAEIATGVLHNVGNTLNSVNISTDAGHRTSCASPRLSGLTKAVAAAARAHRGPGHLPHRDPQGKLLPAYLLALSEQLEEERDAAAPGDARAERERGAHQVHRQHAAEARAHRRRVEEVAVPQLIDEALRLHAVSFERLGIRIERDYAERAARLRGPAQAAADPRQPAEQRAPRAGWRAAGRTSG